MGRFHRHPDGDAHGHAHLDAHHDANLRPCGNCVPTR